MTKIVLNPSAFVDKNQEKEGNGIIANKTLAD